MNVTRRTFLKTSFFAGFAVATKKGWTNRLPIQAMERRDLFPQGVASGDPTSSSVILWTRRPPVKDSVAEKLVVEISTTPEFKKILSGGTAHISADSDWTCRFFATDLQPSRTYWYRFIDEHGFASRIGRTMTAPRDNSDTPVRFTFVSCQCPNEGALNAYRRMIFEDEARPEAQQLNFVLHLGDFIYEVTWYSEDNPDGNRGRRIRDLYKFPQGRKVSNFYLPVTLEDYRTLYRAYLEDPDLQDARARWPFVCIWDNHEFAWAGYQSEYVAGGGYNAPAQNQKVFANQALVGIYPCDGPTTRQSRARAVHCSCSGGYAHGGVQRRWTIRRAQQPACHQQPAYPAGAALGEKCGLTAHR